MKKWFVDVSFGYAGCHRREVIEAKTLIDAYNDAYIMAVENAESFGYYQDEDHFGDLDSVGKDFDEEEGDYEYTGFLDVFVEPYDAEKHEGTY